MFCVLGRLKGWVGKIYQRSFCERAVATFALSLILVLRQQKIPHLTWKLWGEMKRFTPELKKKQYGQNY
jgi:hypothetical protein